MKKFPLLLVVFIIFNCAVTNSANKNEKNILLGDIILNDFRGMTALNIRDAFLELEFTLRNCEIEGSYTKAALEIRMQSSIVQIDKTYKFEPKEIEIEKEKSGSTGCRVKLTLENFDKKKYEEFMCRYISIFYAAKLNPIIKINLINDNSKSFSIQSNLVLGDENDIDWLRGIFRGDGC